MAREIHSAPTTWGAEMAKANNNATELYQKVEVITGTATVDTTTTLLDADGVVVNDAGVMKQVAISRISEYIRTKLTGAISSVLTANATASRVIVSDASGKISSASVTSTELSVIDGDTASAGVTLEDADRIVVNDNGTMRQNALSALWTYISGKITGAASTVLTGNLTASSNVITDSNGKLAVASYLPNRSLSTDSNGYIVTGNPVINEVVYKGTLASVATQDVVSNYNGGFTVSFVRTSSTVYLTVTHTGASSRWQQQYNINSTATVNNWTSSSGANFPMSTPTIPYNGGSMSGWIFCTDGSGQMTSLRIDYSIITNGNGTALLYCRVV